MKFIYLLETRQLNNENVFVLVYTDAFSSLKKASASIKDRIDTNEGYNVSEDNTVHLSKNVGRTDYSMTINGKSVRHRLVIIKKELQ